jgi:hypothetical protein
MDSQGNILMPRLLPRRHIAAPWRAWPPALTVKLADVITRPVHPVGSDPLYIQWSYIPCSLGMTGRVRQIQARSVARRD